MRRLANQLILMTVVLAVGQSLATSEQKPVHGAEATVAPFSGSKPNIIFILADDLAYKDLGAFGQQHGIVADFATLGDHFLQLLHPTLDVL